MANGPMPKVLQDLAGAFMAVMVVGGILIGWLNNRGRPRRGEGGSDDGSSGDEGRQHDHGWWGSADADGVHHGGWRHRRTLTQRGWGQILDHPSDYRFFLCRKDQVPTVRTRSRKSRWSTMLTHFADAFTALSVLTGLWAALQWWRSGRVEVEDPPGLDLSTLKGLADSRHKAALQKAIQQTDTLNSHAAIWTAVSVAAQAVATVLGRLGGG